LFFGGSPYSTVVVPRTDGIVCTEEVGRAFPTDTDTDTDTDLLKSLEQILSEDYVGHIRKRIINSKAIPAPKLLIKDHKEINDDGNYPTRLVLPATNFTSTFS
jgi:hypothetical protein